ncbi:MAG TPA: hypothetical protein VM266_11575 [Solirubrobacteraceae bacterium]|nr:hypothetical protein [Solirubrobacteraceae bacterium]
MQRILRPLLVFAALVPTAAGLVACGGGDDAATADDSVSELLDKTFTGKKDVKSGRVDFKIKMDVQGGGQVSGPVDLTLSGPFQSNGKAKLPNLDIDLSFNGAGQSFKGGVAITGDKGFVNFNGQEYAVSDEVFTQFKQGYEQAAAKSSNESDPSMATLGINPKNWLTNPKNEGDAKVGDADVVKITGGVDVAKLLDDVNQALAKAGQLGVQGSQQLPDQLTEEQKQQVANAVKDVRVEIYTGKEDAILRRMLIALKVDDPQAQADMSFDFSLLELNEEQEFAEPENTKPFEELMQQLGGLGLGGLGGLGGGAGAGAGSGSGSGSGGAAGGTSDADLQKYTDCVKEAGNDVAKAQKCTELLAP